MKLMMPSRTPPIPRKPKYQYKKVVQVPMGSPMPATAKYIKTVDIHVDTIRTEIHWQLADDVTYIYRQFDVYEVLCDKGGNYE